jgi:radical SAM protein with 4Fe4S-binding SPASM domain
MSGYDFNERPFVVIWEITRACGLVCRHCRAAANEHRHPLELTTAESFRLIDQVSRARPALFILTGGDPVRRPDLEALVEYAAGRGLRVGLSPSATPEFVAKDFSALKRAGVARISLSLDGAARESHDEFRGVPGTWDWTMQAIAKARAAGLELQINTTFTRQNLDQFDGFVERLADIQPAMWSVFQLVPTGRGKANDLLDADEMEALFHQLYRLSKTVAYDIKTTEGQHYRRVVLQQEKRRAGPKDDPARSGPAPSPPHEPGSSGRQSASSPLPEDQSRLTSAATAQGFEAQSSSAHALSGFGKARAPLGINDGKGFVFVSHLGEIHPSGFLPVTPGNVRTHELIEVYQNSPVFRELRDTRLLKGKCGRCEYKNICGGSRARAYALTGDYLGEELLCAYEPGGRPGTAEPEAVAATTA